MTDLEKQLLAALVLCQEQLQRFDGESYGWHEANDAAVAAIQAAGENDPRDELC